MKKAVCLLSGGIDSPVATYLASKQYKIIILHFCHYPFYCKGSFDLLFDIVEKSKIKYDKFFIFPYAKILSEIVKSNYRKDSCILCRKTMLKVADKICEKENADCIITGEAISQKASQTLPNMVSTHFNISHKIMHPLLCLDKEEIKTIAKKYNILFEKHLGCCTATPEYPTTKSKKDEIEKIYQELKLDSLIEKNLKNIIEIKDLKDKEEYFKQVIK